MGVAVLPGTAFGPEYGDRVRLSLATRREDIVEAARRIHERVAAIAPVLPARGHGDASREVLPGVRRQLRRRDRGVPAMSRRAHRRRAGERRHRPKSSIACPMPPRARCCAACSSTTACARCCAARRCPGTEPFAATGRRPRGARSWCRGAEAEEARALIADYLAALERGGEVRDEDVEGTSTETP